jgi:hypothetical protein
MPPAGTAAPSRGVHRGRVDVTDTSVVGAVELGDQVSDDLG